MGIPSEFSVLARMPHAKYISLDVCNDTKCVEKNVEVCVQ